VIIDGGANRSDSRACVLPSCGATLTDWLGIVALAFLIAVALLGSIGPLTSITLVLVFCCALWGHARRYRKLWDEKVQLCGDAAELQRQLTDQKKIAETVREAAYANERAKSGFISNISHELRIPLNAIIGMAQLLERSEFAKEQRDQVKVLLESSRELKTLLDDIIALSQPADEPLAAPEDGCDAGRAARTVVRLLQPNAWEKRLRVSINVESGLPRAAADPHLLRRVLLKVVGNAIKFTERGGIDITLDTTSDERGAAKVRCTIADTGPGIPGHLLPAIFEPFTKQDDSYASRHGSSGVGLAVAKQLVESAGGTMGVESEPGSGTSFWLTLPAMKAGPFGESASDGGVTPPTNLAILAFLPDEAMRSAVDRLLTPFGNSVVHSATLAQAVTMSARGGYSIVIAAAASVDALAAAPGQRTPILALAAAGQDHPHSADIVMRWPASAGTFFSAVSSITEDAAHTVDDAEAEAALDAKAFADLEKSLGFKTLIDILQSYLHAAEELAAALAAASEKEDWNHASRLAQDFAGAAGGLGLSALTTAARSLAQSARDGADGYVLAMGTSGIIAEHARVRAALHRLYPDLSA
jgi:signal transduction histidine kinase